MISTHNSVKTTANSRKRFNLEYVKKIKDRLRRSQNSSAKLQQSTPDYLEKFLDADDIGSRNDKQNYTTTEVPPEPKKWLIRLSSTFRTRWDLSVMVLAIWNCFLTPFFISFELSIEDKVSITIIDVFVDCVFLVDIILNFRTTFYFWRTGDEIFDSKMIAKNYLSNSFVIDLLSCFPANLVMESESFTNFWVLLSLLNLLKLVRIVRLNRIINFARQSGNVKLTFRIIQLIFFLIMYVHLTACAWWIVITYDDKWISLVSYQNIYDRSAWHQYSMSLYCSILLLIGSDIWPQTSMHAYIFSALILTGALITAVLLGNVCVLISNLNIKQTHFSEISNAVNTAMKNMKLPEYLQQKIFDYLIFAQSTMANRDEFQNFKQLISPSLFQQVLRAMYQEIIQSNPLMSNKEQSVKQLISMLQPQFCKPEEMIIMQYDIGVEQKFYFVAHGDCGVYVVDQNADRRFQNLLRSSHYFGEIAILFNCERTASVVSLNYVTLGVLSQQRFKQFMNSNTTILKKLKERINLYMDNYIKFKIKCLKSVSVFKQLAQDEIQKFQFNLKPFSYENGDYIAKPGDLPSQFYIVEKGEVRMSITIKGRNPNKRQLQELKQQTEIFPIFGTAGIIGSKHFTELESFDEFNDKKFIELEIIRLRKGSVFGFHTMLSKEAFQVQIKATQKCKLLSVDYNVLAKFRKENLNLNCQLNILEYWYSRNTPYLDDFVLISNQLNYCNGPLLNFRSLVFRVIKENRDQKILKTPLIASMIDHVYRNRNKGKQQQAADSILKMIFHPSMRSRASKSSSLESLIQQLSNIKQSIICHDQNMESLMKKVVKIKRALFSRSQLLNHKNSTRTKHVQTDKSYLLKHSSFQVYYDSEVPILDVDESLRLA